MIIYLFSLSFPRQTAFFASCLSFPVNGGPPFSMSYMTTPSDHQSALLLCPLRIITSGAIYSIVPQNVFVVPYWNRVKETEKVAIRYLRRKWILYISQNPSFWYYRAGPTKYFQASSLCKQFLQNIGYIIYYFYWLSGLLLLFYIFFYIFTFYFI